MVIMYLMKKFQIDFSLSFDLVKCRREIIDPNDGFIGKLKELEGKQYRLRRASTIRGDGCEEIDEQEEFSQFSESSSSESSEDLMESKKRIPSLDLLY